MTGATLSDETMNLLCPMHLRVGFDGTLRHCGPTFRHVRPDLNMSQTHTIINTCARNVVKH